MKLSFPKARVLTVRHPLLTLSAVVASMTATSHAAPVSLATLVTFNDVNGDNPSSQLAIRPNGDVVGMTARGGAGRGNIYSYSPSGVLTTLAAFNGVNGSSPSGRMAFDSSGNIYGTTGLGGAHTSGVVFKLFAGGSLAALHSFDRTNGSSPTGGVVFGRDGALYGTAQLGGADNRGTVFRMTTSGDVSTVATFSSGNGTWPVGPLTIDSAGNLYGTTMYGGQFDGGIVFRLSPQSSGAFTLSTLHSFNGNDGAYPASGVNLDAQGNLYGATTTGNGTSKGTIFKLSRNNGGGFTHSTLWTFTGQDGTRPSVAPIIDMVGNVFGTTQQGGASNAGTIYKLTQAGTLTTLYSFNFNDGAHPNALIANAAGDLYGTTNSFGGPAEAGTLFKLTGSGFVPEPAAVSLLGLFGCACVRRSRSSNPRGDKKGSGIFSGRGKGS